MKFRIVIGLLTVLIIGLFSIVIYLAVDLDRKKINLEVTKDSLQLVLVENDSLFLQNQAQLKSLEEFKNSVLDQEVASDSMYFDFVSKSNTLVSYKNYLERYGSNGKYYNKVLANINEMFNKTGYVQVIETNRNRLFSNYSESDGLPSSAIQIDGKPSVSQENLFIARKAMRVRNGVIGNRDYPNSNPNGDFIQKGQIVKFLETEIPSGKVAKWAKIAYIKK